MDFLIAVITLSLLVETVLFHELTETFCVFRQQSFLQKSIYDLFCVLFWFPITWLENSLWSGSILITLLELLYSSTVFLWALMSFQSWDGCWWWGDGGKVYYIVCAGNKQGISREWALQNRSQPKLWLCFWWSIRTLCICMYKGKILT